MTASSGQPAVGAAEFRALYERLQHVPPWGPADRRGALNYLTPDRGARRGRGDPAGPDGEPCGANRDGSDA
jgi:hypothetical protein